MKRNALPAQIDLAKERSLLFLLLVQLVRPRAYIIGVLHIAYRVGRLSEIAAGK